MTPAGFDNWFRRACDAAELPGRSAHGLRHAKARQLAEAGATAHEIAATTGHESLTEMERYTRAAEQARLAAPAAQRLDQRANAGNSSDPTSKHRN